MKGHWQKDVPAKSGEYWTADRNGYLAGIKTVAYTTDGILVFAAFPVRNETDGWKGWWWSEPVEIPPRPPLWEPSCIHGFGYSAIASDEHWELYGCPSQSCERASMPAVQDEPSKDHVFVPGDRWYGRELQCSVACPVKEADQWVRAHCGAPPEEHPPTSDPIHANDCTTWSTDRCNCWVSTYGK